MNLLGKKEKMDRESGRDKKSAPKGVHSFYLGMKKMCRRGGCSLKDTKLKFTFYRDEKE